MSVLIKGIWKLPGECRECSFNRYDSRSGNSICETSGKILAEKYKPIPFDGRPDNCPLIEVQDTVALPVLGKRIDMKDDYIDIARCSNCGIVEYFNKNYKKFNFCPECGADMRGEA